MLTKMYLTNFLSFYDRTEFDFTASKYNILSETNVSDDGNLKGALIIGANASGKSNALRGIRFLIDGITGGALSLLVYRCYFTEASVTSLEYEFMFDGEKVSYTISFDTRVGEISESLFINENQILIRKGMHGELYIGGKSIKSDEVDKKTLFLRTASFETGRFPQEPVLRTLMDYLNNSYYIDGYNQSAFLGKNLLEYAEENGVEKLNRYLNDFNYDFSLEYGSESNGEGLNVQMESGKKGIFFKRHSFQIPNIFYRESQGNQVFADMLPRIIKVVERPGMLVIDEFGNSLHNKLAEKIIRFFMEKSGHSQIFITSHDTNLISNSVFRPDQINLISFEEKKGSHVKRISVYGPREAQNLEKMYLGGMFEGLPTYDKEI